MCFKGVVRELVVAVEALRADLAEILFLLQVPIQVVLHVAHRGEALGTYRALLNAKAPGAQRK